MPKTHPRRLRAKLFADFRQIHLRDPKGAGSLEEAWTAEATEDRIADGGDIVGIGAADSHDVTVDIEVCGTAPEDDSERWDHVTESCVDLRSGRLAVLGCTDEIAKAKGLEVTPGTWRLRISHAGLQKGHERIRVQMWRTRRTKPRVMKRWAPSPRSAPKLGRIRTAKQAVVAALRGDAEGALQTLVPLAEKGDFAAAASAVQLLAFRGRWRELVPLAMKVIAAPPHAHAEREICFGACDLLRVTAERLRDRAIVRSPC